MTIPVVGLGAGGHSKVINEIIQLDSLYSVIGMLDPDPRLLGKKILGVPVLGDDSLLPQLVAQGISHYFIGLGSVGNMKPRAKLYSFALSFALIPINIIHPSAIISPSAKVGIGFTAMACSIVNACAVIGDDVILNSGAIVEHDCVIGEHVHIATGARLTSTVRVGNSVHIGAGATIRQGVFIGDNAIIGAGAVVITNVESDTIVAGVPARVLRYKDDVG